MEARSILYDQIKRSKFEVEKLNNLREKVLKGKRRRIF